MISTTQMTKTEVAKWNSKIAPEIRTFASGQYICEIAYYLANQNPLPSTIQILDDTGQYHEYHVHPIPLKSGVVAYILAPENKELSLDCKVIFRGTDFSDITSTLINLEHGGPGVESFEEEKNIIFSSLKSVLSQYPAPSLSVYGHSQGASLSQLFLTEFLERRYLHDDFDKIKSATMTVLNSPGVPPNIAKKAEYYVEKIKQSYNPCQVTANYGMVGGDPVQLTGLSMIFANCSSEIVDVNLLKLNRGFEGHWLKDFLFDDGVQLAELIQMLKNIIEGFKAHQNVNFFAPKVTDKNGRVIVDLPTSDCLFYSNNTTENIKKMQTELLNKIAIPSYGFYLATETIRMMDVGYLSKFIPSAIGNAGKAFLNWFSPTSTHYKLNDNDVLVPTAKTQKPKN